MSTWWFQQWFSWLCLVAHQLWMYGHCDTQLGHSTRQRSSTKPKLKCVIHFEMLPSWFLQVFCYFLVLFFMLCFLSVFRRSGFWPEVLMFWVRICWEWLFIMFEMVSRVWLACLLFRWNIVVTVFLIFIFRYHLLKKLCAVILLEGGFDVMCSWGLMCNSEIVYTPKL